MIEVTDEMYGVVADYMSDKIDDSTELIKRIIKLHEQSKPKPKPVAFMFKSDKHQDGVFFLANTYPMNGTPVYTAPPTREPLNDHEINTIAGKCGTGIGFCDRFARAIEQAHGIGVTND